MYDGAAKTPIYELSGKPAMHKKLYTSIRIFNKKDIRLF
jgi:hypothetical protein